MNIKPVIRLACFVLLIIAIMNIPLRFIPTEWATLAVLVAIVLAILVATQTKNVIGGEKIW